MKRYEKLPGEFLHLDSQIPCLCMIIPTVFGHINRKHPFQNAAFLGECAVFGNNVFHVGSHFLRQAPHQVASLRGL